MNYYSTTGKAHVDFHQKSLQRLQNAIHVIIDAHIMCKKNKAYRISDMTDTQPRARVSHVLKTLDNQKFGAR